MVVAKVAISLMLLIGAGLLIRNFVRLQQVSGFDETSVVSMRVSGTSRQLRNRDEVIAYYRPLHDAPASVPGVQSRRFVSALP
ncbi:MAG: hypothetical protein K2Y23_20265 [Cyanobacteria bacterium]|nr:hypothetical protein [Cyanobacteriota bacterium]